MERLDPLILELEREENVLVVCHQAVCRCLLAYFQHLPMERIASELPTVEIPLHTVIKVRCAVLQGQLAIRTAVGMMVLNHLTSPTGDSRPLRVPHRLLPARARLREHAASTEQRDHIAYPGWHTACQPNGCYNLHYTASCPVSRRFARGLWGYFGTLAVCTKYFDCSRTVLWVYSLYMSVRQRW